MEFANSLARRGKGVNVSRCARFFSEYLALLRRWLGRDARYCDFEKVDRLSSLPHRCFGCQLYRTYNKSNTSLHLSYTLRMTRRARSTFSVPVPGLLVLHAGKLTYVLHAEKEQAWNGALCSRPLTISTRKRKATYRGYHMGILHTQNNHVVPPSFL